MNEKYVFLNIKKNKILRITADETIHTLTVNQTVFQLLLTRDEGQNTTILTLFRFFKRYFPCDASDLGDQIL